MTPRWEPLPFLVDLHLQDDLEPPPPTWCGTQRPEEFERLVDVMLEEGVESLLCIGVADGGNQWRIAHRYHEAGRSIRMVCLDVRLTINLARTLAWIGELFLRSTVRIDFRLADSRNVIRSDLEYVGPFDAAWIDGTHAYEVAKNDYQLVEPLTTNFTAFHDIQNIGYPDDQIGSHDLWEEIKVGRRHDEFIFGKKFGIGILYKQEAKG